MKRAIGISILWTGLALAVALALAPAALAQDPEGDRAATFQRVEGPVTEDVPGGPLLVGAYGVAWALILLYVLRLGMLQSRVARDVERLERSLAATRDPAQK